MCLIQSCTNNTNLNIMKKAIIFTSILLPALVALLLVTPLFRNAKKPVNKEINLAISSNNNYNSAAYDEATASVHVVITKVNGNQQTVVSDKIYSSMPLRQVPTNGNAINSKIIVPNVFDGKEKIVVSYTIIYDSRGSVIEFCNGQIAAEKSDHDHIDISI